MSNKSNSTKTKTTSFSWGRIFKFLSFWAVILIGISLIIAKIFPGIAGAFTQIGNILSYIVVLATSFSYAWYKRNVWYFVAWVVALVLIVLFIFL